MKHVVDLIPLAREKVHTDRELAARLGVSPVVLAELKSGKRSMSPETTVTLCDVLELSGEETREWVAVAILENPKNKSKLTLLRRALFACWVLGVGTLFSAPNDAQAGTESNAGTLTNAQRTRSDSLYIVAHAVGRGLGRSVASTLHQARRLANMLLTVAHETAAGLEEAACT